jgi:hypothetical protein
MPGKHGGYCPCDFRYVPDSNGYTCEGGEHRLNKAGEDEHESERNRRQKIMDDQDKQRAADIKRQRENQKEREVETCRRGDREREKGRERQKGREREVRRVQEEQKQKSDFENERREALARVRRTLEAPPATAASLSQGERIVRTPPPEEPVDELDANPMAMPWLGTPGPAEKVREPEFVHARKPKKP